MDFSKLNAVTFVKDDIVQDENLNNMFLVPYNSEVYFDIEKLNLLEDLRSEQYSRNIKFKNIEKASNKIRRILKKDKLYTVNKVITDYLYMNIKDLMMSSIMKFSSIYLPQDTVICNDILQNIPEFTYMVNMGINIEEFENMDPNLFSYITKIYINNYIDAVFSHITRAYFDWLNYMISFYISSDGIDSLYMKAYALAYEGIQPTNIDNTPDNVKYTTIVTIYREALNGELIMMRRALMKVSDNVFNMVFEGYNFLKSLKNQYNMISVDNDFVLALEENNG